MTTWYAIHNADGELVSLGTVLADPLPAGLAATVLDGEPDLAAQQWDSVARAFVPRPAPRIIDPYEWWRRFTVAEEAAIRAAAKADPVIEVLLARLAAPTLRALDLAAPVLVDGMAYVQARVKDAEGQPAFSAGRVAELLA